MCVHHTILIVIVIILVINQKVLTVLTNISPVLPWLSERKQRKTSLVE